MRERPILFSAPMVRALLAGTKTQTRRIAKGAPHEREASVGSMHHGWAHFADITGIGTPQEHALYTHGEEGDRPPLACPYGVPGDRLWVREAFMPRPGLERVARPHYRASNDRPEWRGLWKPSIHMPRWASRLTLEVTDVRVERLAAISEPDAAAEGVQEPSLVPTLGAFWSSRDGFAKLWEQINGAGSWATNPWVWAVSFKVLEQPA